MTFSFLDLIFPKRCVSCGTFGSYFCKNCIHKIKYIDKPICPACQRQAVEGVTHPGCKTKYGLDGLIVGFRYSGPVKLAIKKIKYRWVWDIGEMLVGLFEKNIWKFSLPEKYELVPIPLYRKRKNWRGFNQAELISNLLSNRFNVKSTNLLIRTIETKTQVGLSRDQRASNIKGAFKAINTPHKEAIILVDDVFTTGSTMQEACKVLKKSGVKTVWGLVVALG